MTSLPSGPAPIDASLHLLVEHLLDGLRAGDVPPALLHVTAGDTEGFELGVLPLEGRHPSELLLGTVAPPEWHAVGLASGGWASHSADRAQPDRRRTRVHVVTILSRSGEVAHRMHVEDPDLIPVPVDRLDEEAPGGEQIDLLRRCLELPTDPPPCTGAVYWAIRWLAEVCATPADELTTWDDVAACHPAVPLLRRSPGTASAVLEPLQLVPIARAFARIFDWATIRRLLADGRFEVDELAPADAEWFDDGAFARFLLNRCPPLGFLRQQVDQHLSPRLAARVRTTLGRLDVPSTSWPEHDDRAA